jgi:hypothetical protein
MEWVEEHQYTMLARNSWRCNCDMIHFTSWEDLLEHLRKSVTLDVLGKMVNDQKTISGWRTAYDKNEFDSTWQHNSDAAIVYLVAELLGLNVNEPE